MHMRMCMCMCVCTCTFSVTRSMHIYIPAYTKVNELMVKAGFDAEGKKHQAKQAQQANFKRQLDEQMAEIDAKRKAEKMEKEAESAKVMTDVQNYIAAMDQKKIDQAKMFDNLRKEREKEMEFTRKMQEKERQQKRDDEAREMAKLRKIQQVSLPPLQPLARTHART